jgi:deoxyribodipyrimidine photolyase
MTLNKSEQLAAEAAEHAEKRGSAELKWNDGRTGRPDVSAFIRELRAVRGKKGTAAVRPRSRCRR